MALAGTAVPPLPFPTLFSVDPSRLARFYAHALDFQILQHIPGVCAFLRNGTLPLQVWGRQDARPSCAHVTLDAPDDPSIFDIHGELMRAAPALVDVRSPRAMPWGAWQFCLTDIDGNRLTFTQWPRALRRKGARSTPSSAPASGTPSRG